MCIKCYLNNLPLNKSSLKYVNVLFNIRKFVICMYKNLKKAFEKVRIKFYL